MDDASVCRGVYLFTWKQETSEEIVRGYANVFFKDATTTTLTHVDASIHDLDHSRRDRREILVLEGKQNSCVPIECIRMPGTKIFVDRIGFAIDSQSNDDESPRSGRALATNRRLFIRA